MERKQIFINYNEIFKNKMFIKLIKFQKKCLGKIFRSFLKFKFDYRLRSDLLIRLNIRFLKRIQIGKIYLMFFSFQKNTLIFQNEVMNVVHVYLALFITINTLI